MGIFQPKMYQKWQITAKLSNFLTLSCMGCQTNAQVWSWPKGPVDIWLFQDLILPTYVINISRGLSVAIQKNIFDDVLQNLLNFGLFLKENIFQGKKMILKLKIAKTRPKIKILLQTSQLGVIEVEGVTFHTFRFLIFFREPPKNENLNRPKVVSNPNLKSHQV